MEDTPSINGWKPPVIYDVNTDTFRIATQEDVDSMNESLQLLGTFYRETRMKISQIDEFFERRRTDRKSA